ncbi:putative aminoacrylate hydrolase RutD [Cocos nucifera]|uniref:Putative aminoacrylate hydrolase RutD n=1 Tax=Cocos nucifera TaxID=13894 RepID=A0A8K0I9X8_COCNU|nr:putative aminoacrylate hydrolase RutD [Cocos nucifera]
MPFCEASKSAGEENGMKIFYWRYGHGSTKVLLIIGLAATHDSWGPQIKGLTGTLEPNDEEAPATVGGGTDGLDEEEEGIEVCCFDNRGVGRSSVPTKKSEYTTTIMAKDALALLDHLGWRKAHVFGHSMGAMIACKLAAIAPERLCSLALLNATGGGFECFPKIDRQMLSLAFRFLRAKTPEQRALVDLETHYTQEYVKAISSTGMQSNSGFEGQINACWTHKMKPKELDTIRSSGFLVSVIHGRDDIIAQLNHAKRLAEKLQPAARMVELHGGHLVSHERPEEVNLALIELIKASKSKLRPKDWSYLPERASGWLVLGMPISLSIRSHGANGLVTVYNLFGKIQLSFLYFIGVFVMGFQQMRNFLRIMKPVRVAVSDS